MPGSLHAVPITGGKVADIGDQTFTEPAADDKFVYFESNDLVLKRVAADGNPPTVVFQGGGSMLALDNTNVYYLSPSDCVNEYCGATGSIGKVAKSGGEATILASKLLVAKSRLFANAGFLYFTAGGEDEDDNSKAGVVRMSTDGGEISPFAPGAFAVQMRFDAQYAYWLGSAPEGQYGIIRQALTGGSAELVHKIDSLKSDLSLVSYVDFAMDDAAFVWTDRTGSISVLAR